MLRRLVEARFLARTGADTYQFTNGLWWVDDALWTTDTNRFELKRLFLLLVVLQVPLFALAATVVTWAAILLK